MDEKQKQEEEYYANAAKYGLDFFMKTFAGIIVVALVVMGVVVTFT